MSREEILRDIASFEEHYQIMLKKLDTYSIYTRWTFSFVCNSVVIWSVCVRRYFRWRRLIKDVRKLYKICGIPLDYPMCDLPHRVKCLHAEVGKALFKLSGQFINEVTHLRDQEIQITQEFKKSNRRWTVFIMEKTSNPIFDLLDTIEDVYAALGVLYGPQKEEIAALDREIDNLLTRTA